MVGQFRISTLSASREPELSSDAVQRAGVKGSFWRKDKHLPTGNYSVSHANFVISLYQRQYGLSLSTLAE